MPTETVWAPTSSSDKHAILFHGLSACSQMWTRVARGLVDRGFHVIAPDLPGHGFASKDKYDGEWTVQAFLDLMIARYGANKYDLIMGHSLGGAIAAGFAKHVQYRAHVVLVDPVLEVSNEMMVMTRDAVSAECSNPPSVEEYMQRNPMWSVEDAIMKKLGSTYANPSTIQAICDVNQPANFMHLMPEEGRHSIIVLPGTPGKGGLISEDLSARLAQRTDTRSEIVWGTTHHVQRERPDVVLRAAFDEKDLKIPS